MTMSLINTTRRRSDVNDTEIHHDGHGTQSLHRRRHNLPKEFHLRVAEIIKASIVIPNETQWSEESALDCIYRFNPPWSPFSASIPLRVLSPKGKGKGKFIYLGGVLTVINLQTFLKVA